MPINWPPATGSYPAWPPVETGAPWFSCSSLYTLIRELQALHFTLAPPTTAERQQFFQSTQCTEGHNVIGRILVSPDGSRRYPFAVCNNAAHRELLVLWPPYFAGFDSGRETFAP